MEPNFVLMKLPGERQRRVRRDSAVHAGQPQQPDRLDRRPQRRATLRQGRSSTTFPKTRLVDGPLQIEARIDQNAQLSGQLSLWNQQGSHVRRGSLLVIPIGRALLYAEPIYLQAERSPMPELRLVVLALQDRLAYGPTFEAALAALFGEGPSTLALDPAAAQPAQQPSSSRSAPAAAGAAPPAAPAATDMNALIADAARDLADYQRLTAEGKLGEAGQRLEALKQKLDRLQNHSTVNAVDHESSSATTEAAAPCVLRGRNDVAALLITFGERDHVPVRILDRELASSP